MSVVVALVVIRLHQWGGQQATAAVALTRFVEGDDSVSCDNSGGAIVTIVNGKPHTATQGCVRATQAVLQATWGCVRATQSYAIAILLCCSYTGLCDSVTGLRYSHTGL